MFGRLKLNSIPYHEPIILFTLIIIISLASSIVFYISYLGKWKYIWQEWITTVDHKKIGLMYIIVAFVMLFRGFVDAIMMRFHQVAVSSGGVGFLTPDHYNQIITAHGVIMIIFMAMPFIIGLINFVIPLQIGARDVAFPLLNSISFWLFLVGVILINISLGIGEFAQTGWTAYPPLSGKEYSPGVGVDYWIWSLQISGIGTTLTGINFFTTIIFMRTPNMSIMKMPIFVWTVLCTSLLIIASFPILTTTILLLTLDRCIDTNFFTSYLGGNAMIYINLFWAWGHPEVYILILPIFGIYSEIVATFSQKSIFGYKSLVWATISITILSFCVWLHHFFTMGSGANVNAFFGIMTIIIAVPTGVKIFNWLFTIYKGKINFNSSMMWTLGFMLTFPIGGMSGVLLAVPGINYVLHNSLFLVAHFHNVIIGGVVFGCFAGMTYWFPKAFGFTLNETWGKLAFYFWIIGFYLAFMPLYLLGFMGMTRRLNQNIDHEFFFLLSIAAFGSCLIALGIICQFIQILVSVYYRNKNLDITGDPWNGRTLEWSTSSPPPVYNFAFLPKIKDEIDAFWFLKKRNKASNLKNKKYKPIHMTSNSSMGIEIALFCLICSFSIIWYMWWLSIISFIGIIIIWIKHSFNKDVNYYIPASKIENIENRRLNK